MVSAGFEWRNWSRIGTYQVVGSPTNSVLVFNYRDSYFASIGAEYRLPMLPQLTLRAGFGYDWSPVTDQWRSPGVPDNNRINISAGATYDFSNRLSVSVGYTYIGVDDALLRRSRTYALGAPFPVVNNQPTTLTVGYDATAHSNVHVIGLSARWRWDEPPPAAEAVIAKP
jgi:long-chain fatty acid transport protein